MKLLTLFVLWVGVAAAQMFPFPGPVGSGGAAITLVSHGGVSPNSQTGGSAPAIDTRTANFIVVWVAYYNAAGTTAPVLTDAVSGTTTCNSPCNTWTALTEYHSTDSISYGKFFYSFSPTTGSSHVFTVTTPTGGDPSFTIAAFSGIATSPFDQQNGAGNPAFSTSIQSGAITPSGSNYLVVAGLSGLQTVSPTINGAFTITDFETFHSGATFGSTMAYLIEGVPVSTNPTWSYASTSNGSAAVIVSFK
jgi:hypothetical protein